MKVKVTYPIDEWDSDGNCVIVEKTFEIPEALYCEMAVDRDALGNFLEVSDPGFRSLWVDLGSWESLVFSMIPLSL